MVRVVTAWFTQPRAPTIQRAIPNPSSGGRWFDRSRPPAACSSSGLERRLRERFARMGRAVNEFSSTGWAGSRSNEPPTNQLRRSYRPNRATRPRQPIASGQASSGAADRGEPVGSGRKSGGKEGKIAWGFSIARTGRSESNSNGRPIRFGQTRGIRLGTARSWARMRCLRGRFGTDPSDAGLEACVASLNSKA